MNTTIRVVDERGVDMTVQGDWLKVGRSYRAALVTPHTVTVTRNDADLGSARIRIGQHPNKTAVIDDVIIHDAAGPADVPLLLYTFLREARIAGRTMVCVDGSNCRAPISDLLRTDISNGFVQQRLDYAMHCVFQKVDAQGRSAIVETFPLEVVRCVEHRLAAFFDGLWAQALRTASLTRAQYVATLFHLHSYVRYTTRLLGRCISLAESGELRHHYIEHLKGEINHEKIIERDLEYMGEDVEYLKTFHRPGNEPRAFMALQGSTIAYFNDPVMFLACPIAVEGFAAYFQEDLLIGLRKAMATWGLQDARKADRFLTSHTEFDGGDDGHWNLCVKILRDFVDSDDRMQEFVGILSTAMDTVTRTFDSCITDY